MGVGQGESGKEGDSSFAEIAKPAAVLDPVMTVVMRLFAPPAMTDDRIAQTEGTPAKELFRTNRRPVEAWLAMVRRKWDKGNRTAFGGSVVERNLARMCRSEQSLPPSCSISAIEGKDNSPCLWIGRLTVGQPKTWSRAGSTRSQVPSVSRTDALVQHQGFL